MPHPIDCTCPTCMNNRRVHPPDCDCNSCFVSHVLDEDGESDELLEQREFERQYGGANPDHWENAPERYA